jgi:thiamine-phosphate pyrophosphorylase
VTLPRLHAVTDDEVLAEPGFRGRAQTLMDALGPALAVHVRGHRTSTAALYAHAVTLAGSARAAGSLVLVNDRVDVALATGCGVQLGRRSIPLPAARSLLGAGVMIGYSAHGAAEAHAALADGADFVLLGTVWPSASHPAEPAEGVELIAETIRGPTATPAVIAIGGVTPGRARTAVEAGAYGVAAVSGIWQTPDPAVAAGSYLASMGVAE